MMHVLITYLLFQLALLSDGGKIAFWDFDKKDALYTEERISGQGFTIKSNFEHPEYVKGISGYGLRLDGYSSYVTGKLTKSPGNAFTIAGWFALETWPTDTAGFFALADEKAANWISATVNQFGKPIIGFSANGITTYTGANVTLDKFEWIHVALTVSPNELKYWINGREILSITVDGIFKNVQFEKVTLGRNQRAKHLHNYFPVAHLNGLIDEVAIWDDLLSGGTIQELYRQHANAGSPDLSVPEIRFKNDYNRPQYHILPAANWTNETHGLIYHNGRYHIFNQKNGTNLYLGQINWGHFSSLDLVHWTEHRPVLSPEPGYDQMGIWSGHAVIDDDGQPVLIYTGSTGERFSMNLAYPKDDRLLEWEKYSGNPIVDGVPEGFRRIDFRDPYVWKHEGNWYMIVGFGIEDKKSNRGTVLLYRSANLKNWEFLHTMYEGNPEKDDSGIFWEMPVFWKINDKYVFLVNKVPEPGKPAVALYWVGDFKNERFVPDHTVPKRLEVINRLLSPSVAYDSEGRTIAIAIIPDEIHAIAQLRQGWTHLYSIPRVWDFKNGKIMQSPHPALKALRTGSKTFEAQNVSNGSMTLSSGNRQVEVYVEIEPVSCSRFGFVIGKDPNNDEFTKVYYDFEKEQMTVDRTRSSQKPFIPLDTRSGDYRLKKGDKVSLRMFIDGSVAEVFINDEDAFTTRFFPEKSVSDQIEFFAENGEAKILKAEVWQLSTNKVSEVW